jgi:hypothetical protein
MLHVAGTEHAEGLGPFPSLSRGLLMRRSRPSAASPGRSDPAWSLARNFRMQVLKLLQQMIAQLLKRGFST